MVLNVLILSVCIITVICVIIIIIYSKGKINVRIPALFSSFDQTDFHILFTEQSKQNPNFPCSKFFRSIVRWERSKIASEVVLHLSHSHLILMTTPMELWKHSCGLRVKSGPLSVQEVICSWSALCRYMTESELMWRMKLEKKNQIK